jgi:plastocyanin
MLHESYSKEKTSVLTIGSAEQEPWIERSARRPRHVSGGSLTRAAAIRTEMGNVMRTISIALGVALVACVGLAHAAEFNIDQANKTFSQNKLSVKLGDTINFKNSDDVTHNITVIDKDDNDHDKGLQKPGETIHHTFDAPGDYVVHCQIHPKMKMTVSVQ